MRLALIMSFKFAEYTIADYEVFWVGKLTFGFVNLRPITRHHLLVCPIRIVPRFIDLQPDELSEMTSVSSLIAQKVHNGRSNLAIQDGPEAGQTVSHVHVHIIPADAPLQVDSRGPDRTPQDMQEEADLIRSLLES